jgi:MFS family permease
MAKINRVLPVDISVVKQVAVAEFEELSIESGPQPKHVKRFCYWDFFRDPALRLPTIYQMTIMCSSAITYYGISFNVRNMEGSIYLICGLLGLSDVLGYPSALLISNRLGRRTSLAIYMSLGALFLGSMAILELTVHLVNVPTSVIVLCLLGKFCVAGGRSCARTLVGELYPTAVRSMGSGLSGVGAGIGAIAAPQLAYLGSSECFLFLQAKLKHFER